MEIAAASARSTGSWVFKFLGVLWGACIVISLVKRGFAIELYGLPLAIYEQYVWMRNTLFEPVVWACAYLDISFPVWLKDVVMAYALMAGAHLRSVARVGVEVGRFDILEKIGFTLLWPLVDLVLLMKYLDLLGMPPEMRQQSRIPPDLRRPLNVHRIEDLATSYRDGKRSLGVIVYNIVLVSVLATAFFLWNHLQNAFGPMGYGLDLAANARF